MNVLIAYGSNSGGTMVASEMVGAIFAERGHQVTLKRAHTVDPQELRRYEFVILGSCTWLHYEGTTILEGQLQEHMLAFRQKLIEQNTILPGHPFAVFGLGDESYTETCAAADKLVDIVNDVGGQLVGPPLRITGFFFQPKENEQKIRDWAAGLVAALTPA